MKYAEIRNKIKSGDILMWSEGDWKSWHGIQLNLIRMFTRSEFNHIAVAWVVGKRVFVIEAVVPQIRIYPLSRLGTFHWIRAGRAAWNSEVEANAMALIGEPYSKIEAIRGLFGLTKDNKKWQCAEVVRHILSPLYHGLSEVDATPAKLVEYFAELDKHYVRVEQ